jgi:hypothetical protein
MQKTEVKNKISLASLQYLADNNQANRVPVVPLLFKFLASVAASAMTSAEVCTTFAISSGVRPSVLKLNSMPLLSVRTLICTSLLKEQALLLWKELDFLEYKTW